MCSRWLLLFLLSTLALGQNAPSAGQSPSQNPVQHGRLPHTPAAQPKAAPKAGSAASSLPPDAVVITVQGLCEKEAIGEPAATTKNSAAKTSDTPSSAGCKTLIRKAQFEKLADALNPNMTPAVKRQLAEAYPRLLVFADKAREMGLDKDPRFLQMQKFATLQLLAQDFSRHMQEKAGDISDADVEKYYKDHASNYEQVELMRIFIPNTKQHAEPSTADPKALESSTATPAKTDNAADEAAMKAEAEKIHTAAAANGDFEALQKEAFEVSGLKSASPNVKLGKVTRANLPETHQKVFDLTVGQVSELLSDPGGYYVYKVISKSAVPLSEAKQEIHQQLQSQRMQQSMETLINSVKTELNQSYFGEAAPAVGPSMRAPRAQPGQPSAPPAPPPSQE